MTIEVDGAVRIGGFVIEQPYGDEPGKIGIYRYKNGEGGNFDAAADIAEQRRAMLPSS